MIDSGEGGDSRLTSGRVADNGRMNCVSRDPSPVIFRRGRHADGRAGHEEQGEQCRRGLFLNLLRKSEDRLDDTETKFEVVIRHKRHVSKIPIDQLSFVAVITADPLHRVVK